MPVVGLPEAGAVDVAVVGATVGFVVGVAVGCEVRTDVGLVVDPAVNAARVIQREPLITPPRRHLIDHS